MPKRLLRPLALAGVLALAACGGAETVTTERTVTERQTATETVTETATETVVQAEPVGLPARVAETHAALLAAARSGDYEALRPLIPDEFSYTFGGPVEGGPIAYWQRVEQQSGEVPIEILARILELPYTLFRGTYVWPFAFDKQQDELTAYERELLGDQADAFGAGSGYLGWRAAIEPDGTWRFFIAGD
ncbi:MAG: hypothetical protein ACRDNE_16800 [Gaiellaceae bacterium]